MLRSFGPLFVGLEQVVWLSYVLDALSYPDPPSLSRIDTSAFAYLQAVEVVRIRKASPVEIVLLLPTIGAAIAGVATTAYGIGHGALRLFNHYQRERIHKAEADTRVAWQRWVRQEIESGAARALRPTDALSVGQDSSALEQATGRAADAVPALEATDEVEVVDGVTTDEGGSVSEE